MAPKKKNKSTEVVDERRRAKRVLIQESFSLYLVVPKMHGMVRLYLRDLSRLGLCFQTEMEPTLKKDQRFTVRLYTSSGLYLPIECRVVRILPREVALEFVDPKSLSVQAVEKLLAFLELAEEAGEVN